MGCATTEAEEKAANMYWLALPLAIIVTAYAIRLAYRAGRADREVETRLRADYEAKFENLYNRLVVLEREDAERRRQLHDLVEEYENTVGPTRRETLTRILQETASKELPKTWKQRYGLE